VNDAVREFLHILFKRKRFVLITFLVVAVPIILFTLLRPPTYMARAKLLVVGSRSYLHLSPQETRKTTQIPEAQVLFAEIENLQNRTFLLKAASRLQLELVDPVPTDPKVRARRTAAAIRRNLQVTPFPKTPMIEIAFEHPDKNVAASVVNTIADTYIEYHPSLYESPEVAAFYKKRQTLLKTELRSAEFNLDGYQRETGIVDLEQQLDESVRQMMAAELNLRETDGLIHQTSQLIARLNQSLEAEPERVASDVNMVNNPVARALEERIGMLTVELSELRQKYTMRDRRVQDKMRQIEELRGRVGEQPPRIVGTERFERNPIRQNLVEELHRSNANREGLVAKKFTLEESLQVYQKRILSMDDSAGRLRELESTVRQKREALDLAVRRSQEADLSLQMSADKLDSIRIVDRAQPPVKPYGQNRGLTFIVALIAGAGLGIAGAFGLEFLYQTYHFASDVERELELPVLGLISDIRAH
jgi:succinoglycan biosynthesis transport protein ExoP